MKHIAVVCLIVLAIFVICWATCVLVVALKPAQTKIFCTNDIRSLEAGVNEWLKENQGITIIDIDYYYFDTITLAQMNFYCCITYKG